MHPIAPRRRPNMANPASSPSTPVLAPHSKSSDQHPTNQLIGTSCSCAVSGDLIHHAACQFNPPRPRPAKVNDFRPSCIPSLMRRAYTRYRYHVSSECLALVMKLPSAPSALAKRASALSAAPSTAMPGPATTLKGY